MRNAGSIYLEPLARTVLLKHSSKTCNNFPMGEVDDHAGWDGSDAWDVCADETNTGSFGGNRETLRLI